MISRIVVTAMALCVAVAASAVDLTEKQRAEIEARIKPVGEVCLQGDSDCGGPAEATAGGGEARSGEEVYNTACLACHATGAGDAPILGDVEAWADRIARGWTPCMKVVSRGFRGPP
ncbi:c-type cytochrome [Kineobactrum salinum]|uniref:c-type cytochrome n=1 Tax=Kineobactrum salinum TaxID=2708301 RepID=UPI001E58E087|nr:c-type cytochrome [Kineobactrum salinum]